MTIQASELQGYKSTVINDTTTNGGSMSSTEIVSGVSNNVFPNVFTADRVAGLTTYRKTFWKVGNDDDESLFYPQLWLDIITAGDDWVTFYVGTQTDIQTATPGNGLQRYGVGTLYSDAASAQADIIVDTEDATLVTVGGAERIYRVGDKIRITDKATISGSGNEEILEISVVGAPTGTRQTLTCTTNLVNSYAEADNTRIMTVYEPATVASTVDTYVDTNSIYDEVTTPVLPDSIGGVEDTWTITFTSTTEFGCVGSSVGSVGTGDVSTEFAPSNSAFTKPYFTLDEDGWGTPADTNVFSFQTHPAAVPIWQKRVVPAACGSLSGNKTTMVFGGES